MKERCWLGNLGRVYAALADIPKTVYNFQLYEALYSQILPESHPSLIGVKELLNNLLRFS